MTLLALMPCQDKDDKVTYSFDTTISKSKGCNDQQGQENCPPFCTCYCCSSVRYIESEPVNISFVQEIVRDYPAHKIPVVLQQALDIWQPPQIA